MRYFDKEAHDQFSTALQSGDGSIWFQVDAYGDVVDIRNGRTGFTVVGNMIYAPDMTRTEKTIRDMGVYDGRLGSVHHLGMADVLF